jgi:hypothetical protein
MMLNISPYIPEATVVNGTIVLNVTATPPTIQFFPASIVMSTAGPEWTMHILRRGITNMPVVPVWIATQRGEEAIKDISF